MLFVLFVLDELSDWPGRDSFIGAPDGPLNAAYDDGLWLERSDGSLVGVRYSVEGLRQSWGFEGTFDELVGALREEGRKVAR